MPCRYAPRVQQDLKDDLEVLELSRNEYGCTVATDGWKDVSNGKRLNTVSVTSQGSKFEKSTCVTGREQTAEMMVTELEKILLEIGESKVAMVIADGASNMKSALEKIETAHPKIMTLRCMAHLCQLLFKV